MRLHRNDSTIGCEFQAPVPNASQASSRLKGLQPKTIEAYSRAIWHIGAYFDHQIEDLSEQQLIDYFTDLLDSHSWSAVKLDLVCWGSIPSGYWRR